MTIETTHMTIDLGASSVSPSRVMATIEEIIEEARQGRPFILVDAEDRENEGDVVIPAQMASPEQINFMARFARGLICLALTKDRAQHLRLPPMVTENGSRNATAFTVAIEAREGVSTGISAHDRAHTISVAIDPRKDSNDIVSPGHVFPLVAKDGGVLSRAGHTEAAVDISKLAGLNPSGVICEVMNDDGTMARLPDLIEFAKTHGLRIGTIADLIDYRRQTEKFVSCVSQSSIVSRWGGQFELRVYMNSLDGVEHLALIKRAPKPGEVTLVRMHQLDIVSDMIAVQYSDISGREAYIEKAMKALNDYDGPAVMVILRDPDPKLLSKRFDDRSEMAGKVVGIRDYGVGAQILIDLGVKDMIALSSTRPRPAALTGYGLSIIDWKSL